MSDFERELELGRLLMTLASRLLPRLQNIRIVSGFIVVQSSQERTKA